MNEAIRFDGPYNAWSEQCFYCRWYRGFSAKTMTQTCQAFPEGIPLAFWNDQERHDQPFPGDNGIQFAPFTPEDIEQQDQELEAFLSEYADDIAKIERDTKQGFR